MEMDIMTIQLQEFLDGSLPPEQEAELLHRLSVSPERRNLLRSYMKQQAVISTDRASIAVPYATEQKLWAALAALPPAAAPVIPAATSVAPIAATSVFFKVAAVALVSAIVGLGSGYFLWHSEGATSAAGKTIVPGPVAELAPAASSTTSATTTLTDNGTSHTVLANASRPAIISQNHSIVSQSYEAPLPTLEIASVPLVNDPMHLNGSTRTIPEGSYFLPASVQIRDPYGVQYNRPALGGSAEVREQGFLERFDLQVHEAVGKQFPNTTATNTSYPIIINSDVQLKYMLNQDFWVGVGVGTSNVTQKKLSKALIDDGNPLAGYTIVSDLVHEQTNWVGASLEYRIPVSSRVAIAANAGIAASSLGPIYSSEIGARFDVSTQIGILAGVRGTMVYSSATQQYEAVKAEILQTKSPSPTSVGPDVSKNNPNYNLELSTGIYFHF